VVQVVVVVVLVMEALMGIGCVVDFINFAAVHL